MPRTYHEICPVARTLDIIGERWTMLILRDLFLGDTKFNEFLRRSPRMPTRVLSERLKLLEEHGFVERAVYSEHPLRAEYRLTELGWSIGPVLEAIFRWGIDHTLDARQRGVVLKHLYGSTKPETMEFPPPGRAKRPATRRAARVKSSSPGSPPHHATGGSPGRRSGGSSPGNAHAENTTIAGADPSSAPS